jgi:hypothetical protein
MSNKGTGRDGEGGTTNGGGGGIMHIYEPEALPR